MHSLSGEEGTGGFDVLAMRQDHRIPSRIVDSDARILRGASPLTSPLRVRGVVKSFTPRPLVLPLYRSLRYHSANSLPLKHALWWPLRFTKRGDEQELRSAQNSPPPLSFIPQTPSPRIPFGRGRGKESCVSVVIPADPLSRDPVPFRKTLVQRLWTPAFAGVTDSKTDRHRGAGGILFSAASVWNSRGGRTPSPRGRGMRRSPENREEFTRKERGYPLAPHPRRTLPLALYNHTVKSILYPFPPFASSASTTVLSRKKR